jgi:hypothetical protein
MHGYETKKELRFEAPVSTGYSGAVLYFEQDGWRITVNAMYVEQD